MPIFLENIAANIYCIHRCTFDLEKQDCVSFELLILFGWLPKCKSVYSLIPVCCWGEKNRKKTLVCFIGTLFC